MNTFLMNNSKGIAIISNFLSSVRKFFLWGLPILIIVLFIYRSSVLQSVEIGEPFDCKYEYCSPDLIDHQGSVWFDIHSGGECIGLGVSDGEELITYTVENSGLFDNCIVDIALDDEGQIWLANGKKGISIFDGKKWESYTEFNSGV